MISTVPELPFPVPEPDQVRAAIEAVDRQARLLRRLLRVSICMHVYFAPAQPDSNSPEGQAADHAH
jgi:hypothetical protein